MYSGTIQLPPNIVSGVYTLILSCALTGCQRSTTVEITSPNPPVNVFEPYTTGVAGTEIILDNGIVRARINLAMGGMMDYLAPYKNGQLGESVINSYRTGNAERPDDVGRQKGVALYSGPAGGENPANAYFEDGQSTQRYVNSRLTGGIGYNIVQGGDESRYPAPVWRTGVRIVPGYGMVSFIETPGLNWHLYNRIGHYRIQQWAWLDGNTVRFHYKIIGSRPDYTQYEARTNELGYCYVTAKHTQYYAVLKGSTPERIDQWLTTHRNDGTPQMGWQKDHNVAAGEPWMAAINPSTGIGVGYANITGFHDMQIKSFGDQGSAGPNENDSGYMASTPQIILDHDLEFELDDAVIIGTLEEIQVKARQLTQRDYRPHFVFRNGRQFVSYLKGTDEGWRVPSGKLVITPYDKRFEIHLPVQTFSGSDVPNLYLRMKYIGPESQARLRWRQPDQSESEAAQIYFNDPANDQRKEFTVQSGVEQTYVIPLSSNANWNGKRIAKLWIERFTKPTSEAPEEVALSGETWEVTGISYKPFDQW